MVTIKRVIAKNLCYWSQLKPKKLPCVLYGCWYVLFGHMHAWKYLNLVIGIKYNMHAQWDADKNRPKNIATYVTHDPLRTPVWFPNCSVRTYMYLESKFEYINKKSNGRK